MHFRNKKFEEEEEEFTSSKIYEEVNSKRSYKVYVMWGDENMNKVIKRILIIVLCCVSLSN